MGHVPAVSSSEYMIVNPHCINMTLLIPRVLTGSSAYSDINSMSTEICSSGNNILIPREITFRTHYGCYSTSICALLSPLLCSGALQAGDPPHVYMYTDLTIARQLAFL